MAGLLEIARVLCPAASVAFLILVSPGDSFGKLYRVYFKHVLPRLGTVISGVKGPYAYLPASVERFPQPDELLQRMRNAGFRMSPGRPILWNCRIVSREKTVGLANRVGADALVRPVETQTLRFRRCFNNSANLLRSSPVVSLIAM